MVILTQFKLGETGHRIMVYCHSCSNPILGEKFVAGDYNTFYHPACDKLEQEKHKDVKTMATFYNELYMSPKPRQKKSK